MRLRRVPDDDASAGISSMIIFIALVLVSAVVAIVLITFGQELFQNSSSDAEDTSNVMYGKIIISNAVITAIDLDANENPTYANIQITLELSPGAPTVADEDIKWSVLCQNENQPNRDRWSNDGNLEAATTANGDGGDVGAVDEIEFGVVYMLTISLHHTTDNNNDGILDDGGCPPNNLETHTLVFVIGNSGSYTSWDLRYDEQLEEGEILI